METPRTSSFTETIVLASQSPVQTGWHASGCALAELLVRKMLTNVTVIATAERTLNKLRSLMVVKLTKGAHEKHR
jgi:hypothetical protein